MVMLEILLVLDMSTCNIVAVYMVNDLALCHRVPLDDEVHEDLQELRETLENKDLLVGRELKELK